MHIMPSSVGQSTPPDVVREIFKHFATRLKLLKNGSTHQFPWHLGHICSTWRAVFLSMYREFWSEIQFDSQPPEESASRYTQIAEFFLERGQNVPISFKFLEGIPLRPVSLALMAQSERWLDASFDSLHSTRLLSVNNGFPKLRSLTINHIENLEEPDIFKNASNLTRLALTTISVWNLNWPSLTIFELTNARISDHFLAVLSQMESLERLLVKQTYFDDEIDAEASDIMLPRLKVLVIAGFMISLLLIITTPVLEGLYLDTIDGLAWQEPYDVCPYFFKNSPCDRLNRLTIHSYDEMFVAHVLLYTPHVQFLNLMLPDDACEQLYYHLTCTQEQAPLLPVMQRLCMYCTGKLEVDFDIIEAMVESRTNSTDHCFRELVFMFDDPNSLMPFSWVLQPICDSNHIEFKVEVFDSNADLASSFLYGGCINT